VSALDNLRGVLSDAEIAGLEAEIEAGTARLAEITATPQAYRRWLREEQAKAARCRAVEKLAQEIADGRWDP